jgi:hypothetical protein
MLRLAAIESTLGGAASLGRALRYLEAGAVLLIRWAEDSRLPPVRVWGLRLAAAVSVLALAVPAVAATPGPSARMGPAAVPALYKNCTALNKKWPHGVGKVGARDKTSGKPVTTFKRFTHAYNIAISYNKSLDRDKDGIACEQA